MAKKIQQALLYGAFLVEGNDYYIPTKEAPKWNYHHFRKKGKRK